MKKYNHMYTIAFEVISEHETGDDVTADMLADALIKRIASLKSSGDLIEATGYPDDTYLIEEKNDEIFK